MRTLGRVVLVVTTFVALGFGTMHVVIARAVARGTPEYEVRLAGAMTGLFVGGAAASLLTLALLLGGRATVHHEDE